MRLVLLGNPVASIECLTVRAARPGEGGGATRARAAASFLGRPVAWGRQRFDTAGDEAR
jgi:hypothetical protein